MNAMVGIERALLRWQAAGLISGEAAAAIRDFERANRRLLLLTVLAGLGLLALGLGILLVVAANWDLIPGPVKLGLHFLAMLAAAGLLFHARLRGRDWLSEGAAIVLAALIIAGLALQGQVYQLTSPLWQPMVLWAALTVPFLLIAGTSWLTGSLLALILGAAGLALAAEGLRAHADTVLVGAAASMPYLALLLARIARRHGSFLAGVKAVALGQMLILASLAHILWAVSFTGHEQREVLEILAGPFLLLIACLALARDRSRLEMTVLVATFAAGALAVLTPHQLAWHWQLFGALSFILMWAVIGWAALSEGARPLFGLAALAIGLRLFIIYFEVFGSLAATGAGLIIAGLLLLGLLAGGNRVLQRFGGAPR